MFLLIGVLFVLLYASSGHVLSFLTVSLFLILSPKFPKQESLRCSFIKTPNQRCGRNFARMDSSAPMMFNNQETFRKMEL